jgi:hypothetical protein
VFQLRGLDSGVREIAFWQEGVPAARRGTAIEGRAWVDDASGRVRRTELRTGVAPTIRLTTTTFGRDAALGIEVPVEMKDDMPYGLNDDFQGRATYSRFRRFQVRAQETIEAPPTPR